jgi:hypothetical protein
MFDYRIFYPQIGLAEQRVRRAAERPARPEPPRPTTKTARR